VRAARRAATSRELLMGDSWSGRGDPTGSGHSIGRAGSRSYSRRPREFEYTLLERGGGLAPFPVPRGDPGADDGQKERRPEADPRPAKAEEDHGTGRGVEFPRRFCRRNVHDDRSLRRLASVTLDGSGVLLEPPANLLEAGEVRCHPLLELRAARGEPSLAGGELRDLLARARAALLPELLLAERDVVHLRDDEVKLRLRGDEPRLDLRTAREELGALAACVLQAVCDVLSGCHGYLVPARWPRIPEPRSASSNESWGSWIRFMVSSLFLLSPLEPGGGLARVRVRVSLQPLLSGFLACARPGRGPGVLSVVEDVDLRVVPLAPVGEVVCDGLCGCHL